MLAAGKAVREQRNRANFAVRAVKQSGQRLALGIAKIEPFCGHEHLLRGDCVAMRFAATVTAIHYVARELAALGHDVKQVPPTYAKPFRQGHKNDFRDAHSVAEAVQRPTTRFVPAKTNEQLDLQALHRVRSRLVSERTAVINQIRGFLLERGIIVRQGLRFLRQALPDNAIPASMPMRQGGRFASLDEMRPRDTFSRNTMAPRESRPGSVQTSRARAALAYGPSPRPGGLCVSSGRLDQGIKRQGGVFTRLDPKLGMSRRSAAIGSGAYPGGIGGSFGRPAGFPLWPFTKQPLLVRVATTA